MGGGTALIGPEIAEETRLDLEGKETGEGGREEHDGKVQGFSKILMLNTDVPMPVGKSGLCLSRFCLWCHQLRVLLVLENVHERR